MSMSIQATHERFTSLPPIEVFTMVADAPVVGAYVASTVGYFGAFMSDWPMISRFGTTEFFLVMISLGLVAIGAKYSNALD